MMMNSAVLHQLDRPLVQAPMAGSQDHRLAVAVGLCGGLGSLPCAMLTPEQMVSELRLLRTQWSGPINVNFFAHTPPQPDEAVNQAWLRILKPLYDEFGVGLDEVVPGPGRQPFNSTYLDALAPFKPEVVSFHFGLPNSAMLEPIKGWGGEVWSSATTVDEARWLQAHGADVIIAQGLEAGGHRGHFLNSDLSVQCGTFALLPQVVAAVQCPVVAAGGVATSQGVQAALALGASAVQAGSAFLLAHESTTTQVHRAALKASPLPPTALTNLFSGRPARGLVNRLMKDLGALHPGAPAFPLATPLLAPLRAAVERQGLGDCSPLWCGQHLAVQHEEPAEVIVARLCAGLKP